MNDRFVGHIGGCELAAAEGSRKDLKEKRVELSN